ncbi:MAG: hypothetical protein Q8S33_31905 [Myxococcales bacterium]|nr:hypothetical protein [Myxococcales bacterium]MDP3238356.1 hypothetical protein [Myxococcales bacterium]MDP3504986.1 hypothetical protein [Myxococcales bacterium]
MDRPTADAALAGLDLVPFAESAVAQAKELERMLLANDIPVILAKPPAKACCGGGCGCGAKVQLMVREDDAPKIAQLLQADWLDAVRREGTIDAGLVPLRTPAENELICPACQFVGVLVDGMCQDCGLVLE